MTFHNMTWYRAIPAFMAGIAFFLTGCPPKVPVEKRVPEKVEVEERVRVDFFALAESYLEKGETDRAIEAYLAYLEEAPEGPEAVLALVRLMDLYVQKENYAASLQVGRLIIEEHPHYPDMVQVRYKRAKTLQIAGRYERAREEALDWLETYPDDPLRKMLLLVAAESSWEMGDVLQAFRWWLEAKEAWAPRMQEDIQLKLDRIIDQSGEEELETLAEYARGREETPKIYYRLATIHLARDELKQARHAAMALVRSTTDQAWVNLGRQLLWSTEEEVDIRRGAIGCLLPLSGPFAIYGEEVLNGMLAGMRVFKSDEDPSRIELIIKDTKGEPEKALEGLKTLATQDRVIGIIGPLTSKPATAAAVRAQDMGLPMITLTQKEGITEMGDLIFRNFMTPSKEVKSILDTAIHELGLHRFAILYPDNSYGRFFLHLFWDTLEQTGAVVTAVEAYNPEDTDFAQQMKKMTGRHYPRPGALVEEFRLMWTPEQEECEIYPEKPEPIIDFDAVFIPDVFQRVAMIAPQLVYHDIEGVLLMGTSLWQSPKLIEQAGDYVQEALFPSGFFADTPDSDMARFVATYRDHFNAEPGVLAATGYDTIRMLERMMDMGDVRTRRDFKRVLRSRLVHRGVTGLIVFGNDGEVIKKPTLLTVAGKKMIPFHPKNEAPILQ